MTWDTAAKRAKRRELAEARARLIGRLLEIVGPSMSAEKAESVLEEARAWAPRSARRLDEYVEDHSDAFTQPSPHCPMPLVRLLQQLAIAGYGDKVTQPVCVRCRRPGLAITRLTPEGRCCEWCVARTVLRSCARCGQDGHIAALREEGPICRRCYRVDEQFVTDCAECGRHGAHSRRRDDGALICWACAPKPDRECVRCGAVGPAKANLDGEGPVCRGCYTAPAGLCRKCGRHRPIAKRGDNGQPGICINCHAVEGECGICGRFRRVRKNHNNGGPPACRTCRHPPHRECGDCGRSADCPVTWPIGPVCNTCYTRRRRNPAPCSRCGELRVLVDRTVDGTESCGPCSGVDIGFSCRHCGFPGDIYADGYCARCVVHDQISDLLSGDGGEVPTQLTPLADALISAQFPQSVLKWIRSSASAQLLAELAAVHSEITHDLLDGLPQSVHTRSVRETLVATGVLAPRHEGLARLELWIEETLDTVPSHQRRLIRPFAEWAVLRDARRRAARDRFTPGTAEGGRRDIRAAIELVDWLDRNSIDLASLDQGQFEIWLLAVKPTRRVGIGRFIRWTNARRLTVSLEAPSRRHGLAERFMDEDEHQDQLRRCLTDTSLPLELRIIGALVRLYALPLTRIVQLTTDRFVQDESGSYLVIAKHPVLLPPSLTQLIEQQIARGRTPSMLPTPAPAEGSGVLLLPGRPAHRPRNPDGLAQQLNHHGLPTIAARHTAMIGMASELPPIVISDLFGIHRNTANNWAGLAQDGWADYLAACRATE
ncbi:XRE family transcriptional regulator [Streptomyces canus]|uniref:XRE family transcriptional regulator n=1 Tax=Streptomyces canus TaxID=58343 RepID=UPI0033C9AE95